MSNYKIFDPQKDVVVAKQKVKVFPIWSDSPNDTDTNPESILRAFFTASTEVSAWEGYYYYNIFSESTASNANAPVQFSISYGTYNPLLLYHSDEEYQYTYPSKAVYCQHISSIVDDSSTHFGRATSSIDSTNYQMTEVYFIDIARARLKDSVELNTWQLNLSGSGGPSGSLLTLINYPATDDTTLSYSQIVTGDLSDYSGTVSSAIEGTPVGVFYPDRGVFILDAKKIHTLINTASIFNPENVTASGSYTASQALNCIYQLISKGSYFRARTKENVNSTSYFCRAANYEFNYSTNPTWVTGSDNQILDEFYSDPKTYITTVGLYDGEGESGQLVAVAKLSRPIPKTTDTEALIKVMLQF